MVEGLKSDAVPKHELTAQAERGRHVRFMKAAQGNMPCAGGLLVVPTSGVCRPKPCLVLNRTRGSADLGLVRSVGWMDSQSDSHS